MQKTTQKRFVSPADIGLIAFLLAVCLLFWVYRGCSQPDALRVVIEKNGEVIYSQPLDPSAPTQHVVVEGTALEVCITTDGAAVVSSDCPDQICVRTGELHRAGDTAVCLPNQVVLRLLGTSVPASDGITG